MAEPPKIKIGTVYHDQVNNVMKVYDGKDWQPMVVAHSDNVQIEECLVALPDDVLEQFMADWEKVEHYGDTDAGPTLRDYTKQNRVSLGMSALPESLLHATMRTVVYEVYRLVATRRFVIEEI